MTLNFKKRVAHILLITPALAAQWLERNTINRRVKPSLETRYTRDMAAGKWMFTHQGISFDINGVLVDGQHRLQAIVNSGKSLEFVVVTGLASAARALVDTQPARSVANAFQFADLERLLDTNKPNASAAMWGMMKTGLSNAKGKETRPELLEFAKLHEKAGVWALKHFAAHTKSVAYRAPVMAAVARAYYHVPKQRLAEFVEVVCSGLPEGEDDHSAVFFRNALINIKNARSGTNSNHKGAIYGKTTKAIEAFVARDVINKFYVPSVEPFLLPEEEAVQEEQAA